MENRFLLACECGRQLTIDPGQAGQELTCACGRKVQAPATLQELRRLPRAQPPEAAPAANWGESQRGVFGCGALLVVLGLIASGYFGYHWWHVGDTEKPDDSLFTYNVDIDKLTPTEILDNWEKAGKDLPLERPMPAYLFARAVSGRLILLMTVGGGLIAAGIAACLAASWLAQPQKAAEKK